jgi:hypothetical protein
VPSVGLRYSALLATVTLCTLLTVFGGATGFFIPNTHLPSESLVVEIAIPATVIGVFSLVGGYVCPRAPNYVRGGALAGAANMTVSCAGFLLVMGLFDRHFAATGGRGLIMYLSLAGLMGFGLAALAGLLREVGSPNGVSTPFAISTWFSHEACFGV